MSYCIGIDWSNKLEGEDYENLTFSAVESDEDLITQTEQFEYWYEDYKDDIDEDEDVEEHKKSLIDSFRCSSAYDELRDSYVPMMYALHILQYEPTDDRVKMVEKYAGVISVISMEDLDVCGLALTGSGMDLSDNLELAYYILDGVSPIKASQVMSLSKEAHELLKFCRDKVEKTGSVGFYEIQEHLGVRDDN